MSQLSDRFAELWKQHGFDGPGSAPTREHLFHPYRKWRFDFCWPEYKLAVELDGMGYGHQSVAQRKADNEKANAAVELGWRILRYDSSQLAKSRLQATIEQVKRCLAGEAAPEYHKK